MGGEGWEGGREGGDGRGEGGKVKGRRGKEVRAEADKESDATKKVCKRSFDW